MGHGAPDRNNFRGLWFDHQLTPNQSAASVQDDTHRKQVISALNAAASEESLYMRLWDYPRLWICNQSLEHLDTRDWDL